MTGSIKSGINTKGNCAVSQPELANPIHLGGLSEDIGFALRFAQLAVFKDLVTAFRPFDIRPGKYVALKVIANNPGMPVGQLGELLCIQKPNLVALMKEFERRGLVTKERSKEDGRSRALTLSPRGHDLLRDLDQAHDEHRARLAAIIGPKDKKRLLVMLNRLAALDDEQNYDV